MQSLKDLKELLLLVVFVTVVVFLATWCESGRDPYAVGAHWNYTIECENGFVYKVLDQRRGVIQIHNSDGTPLKCGKKIY